MAQVTKPRVIVAISGASGAIYGIKSLELLRAHGGYETHLVISPAGARTKLKSRPRIALVSVINRRRLQESC